MDGNQRGDRSIASGDLLQEQGIGDGIEVGAVPLGWGGGPKEPEFAHFRDDFRLDRGCLFARGRLWRQPLRGEAPARVDNELVRFVHEEAPCIIPDDPAAGAVGTTLEGKCWDREPIAVVSVPIQGLVRSGLSWD